MPKPTSLTLSVLSHLGQLSIYEYVAGKGLMRFLSIAKRGDYVLGSVSPFVCPFVCMSELSRLNRLIMTYDLDIWYLVPIIARMCRSAFNFMCNG